MTTQQQSQDTQDRFAALLRELSRRVGPQASVTPQIGDVLIDQLQQFLDSVALQEAGQPVPPDGGFAQLVGVGDESARNLGETRLPAGIVAYDETVISERVIAVGDLYYLYQHERLGLFRVMRKLQELFRAGTVRLSSGPGAFGLYRFDRRDVLRYTSRDRVMAYRRVLGYTNAPSPAGSQPNALFHRQFSHFVNQVGLFWRDKRISDVIRERAADPSFGSIAVVRRAGLDLRNNLKFASFGHLNVLRVELMQVLDEAFRILESDDVKRLFGADNAWDVIEEVLMRYFNERLVTSPRQRMAVAGREVLRWLAQPHVLQRSRPQFETTLREIAEYSEEWLTSAQALGDTGRSAAQRVLPFTGRAPTRPGMAGVAVTR
jgi:hypothetical protein